MLSVAGSARASALTAARVIYFASLGYRAGTTTKPYTSIRRNPPGARGRENQARGPFNSQYFFPLDGAGWQAPGVAGGDLAQNDNSVPPKMRNFSFTTELHTKFKYTGGETFTFDGDDDLWVFVNRKLAIDLGGLHSPTTGMIALDALAATFGLTKGNTYPLDLFHAERHTTASHFRVDTTLSLVDCGSIPPDVPR